MSSVISKASLLIGGMLMLLTACSPDRDVTTSENVRSESNAPTGQLPRDVEPRHYSLQLRIDPSADQFSGVAVIDITFKQGVSEFWLHGNELQVESVKAALPSGDSVSGRYEQVESIGVAKVTFDKVLPAGTATVEFVYSAPFNTNLEGLYKVHAGDDDYAFTQFEATSARLAFPGFDEPGFKVPFDITLEVPAGQKAVTNTPLMQESLITTEAGTRLQRLQFATTKPLPTYLIAFAVGPLDEVAWDAIPATALRPDPVPLRGYAVRGKGEQLRYALSQTQDIVLTQEAYFGIAYPYKKLDLIAVPDFGAGAMENAGAITYREQYLLLGEDPSVAQKFRFAYVHAHELTHQWFGDLVTPNWWEDTWLNEAFATWMGAKTMHKLRPDDGFAQRMLESSLEAMNIDSLVSTRRIRQPITVHQDIGSAFDNITYEKGSAVLSMLERFVGEEQFRQGIQRYLTEFRFGVANAEDFVNTIGTTRADLQEGVIRDAFFSFLEQPGIPFVDLNWSCDNGASTTINIKQSRYLPLGSGGDSNQQWLLPLCFAFDQGDSKQSHCQLLEEPVTELHLSTEQCPKSIMPNADAAGYYRFNISASAWETLLKSPQLNDREMLAAADSLSASFHAGRITTEQYLSLIPLLFKSDNAQVLTAPLADLYLINKEMGAGQRQGQFGQLVGQLYDPVYASVALDKNITSVNQIQLRTAMMRLYGKLVKRPTVRQQLRTLAVAFTGYDGNRQINPGAIDNNLREIALTITAEMEDKDFAELLLDHFHNSTDALLRGQLLHAAAASKSPEIQQTLLQLTLSESIRDNEVREILQPLMREPDTRDRTWSWIRANMNALVARSPSWFQGSIIHYAGEFCSLDRYTEIKDELTGTVTALGSGPRNLAETLESIQLCAAMVDQHKSEVARLLSD